MKKERGIVETVAALQVGRVTSVGLVAEVIETADQFDRNLGMFAERFVASSLDEARIADDAAARGESLGPLHGIPIALKDVIASREAETRAGSVLRLRHSNAIDATVVTRLRAAGAIVVGKTTTMEYAIGLPDPTKDLPVPRNPWNAAHWAGGSSSGSASAVAVGAALAALGTDTGGSVRIPSAFCGITGLKPTFGLVPRTGCIPLGYSMDVVGPMARSAEDCAVLLGVIAGGDCGDPSSVGGRWLKSEVAESPDLTGLRVGVDSLVHVAGAAADQSTNEVFQTALAALERQGATLISLALPLYDELTFANRLIQLAEGLAFHKELLRAAWLDYGQSTRLILAEAALYGASDYVQAQRVRRSGQRAVATLFDRVDVIVTPTSSSDAGAFLDSEGSLSAASAFGPIHTQYWSAVGNPAISVPMGFSSRGLPLGMQIVGRPHQDGVVLGVAIAFQRQTDWHTRRPPSESP